MILTKNIQTEDNIIKMVKKAFGEREVESITELTEGMCNAAYRIVFSDKTESILKITSKDKSFNTSNEVNLMDAEVQAMNLVKENTDIPVAKVYCYDKSLEICDSSYFFMEKMPGENLNGCREGLEADTLKQIYEEVGFLSKKLTGITNCEFGFLGEDRSFESLYDFIYVMLTNLLSDAKKMNVDILVSGDELLKSLELDKPAFDEVKYASVVHWDMWEGNIFVKDGHVSGIIDWERAIWGDPLQDDRFRHHSRNEHFVKGFGIETFTDNELKRIRWYDIILYLTMMIEVFFRGFEDDGQYKWAGQMLREVL